METPEQLGYDWGNVVHRLRYVLDTIGEDEIVRAGEYALGTCVKTYTCDPQITMGPGAYEKIAQDHAVAVNSLFNYAIAYAKGISELRKNYQAKRASAAVVAA